MRVTTQKVSSQLGPGTTWAQSGSMWWGSVTFRVKGKVVPRDVTRVRSRITQDEVKSGVNLERQTNIKGHKKCKCQENERSEDRT